MARKLKGGVLRAFPDHRSKLALAYSQLVRDKQDELGTLPRSARPVLREYARLVIELDQNAIEIQKPSVRKRAMDFRRLKREIRIQRLTMLKLEQRLQQLASQQQASVDPLEALFPEEEVKA